ncbi:TPA: hypothetical protein RM328_004958 [Escherichia coli]|nr:hypothetical protein [Escherichia coli]
MRFLFLLFCVFIYESMATAAEYTHLLWSPANLSDIAHTEPVYIDDTGNTEMSFNPPYITNWRLLYCASNHTDYSNNWADFTRRYWIVYPSGWNEYAGLRYKITPNINNQWFIPQATPVPGHNIYVSSITKTSGLVGQCFDPGTEYTITPIAVPPHKINIFIDRNTTLPGSYNIPFSYGWGYEENKGSIGDENSGYLSFGIELAKNKYTTNIPVIVTSKCEFSSRNITIEHGVIDLFNNVNNTASSTIDMDCTNNTSLNIEVIGSESGSMEKNLTKCGEGGVCKLTVENTGSAKVIKRVSGKTSITVSSTYSLQPGGHPVGGRFEGAGILRILID